MTINEKILKIIAGKLYSTENLSNEIQLIIHPKKAADVIEKLILSEKIDLLNNLYVNKMDGQENLYDAREDKIKELTTQLNLLNKQ